MATEMQVDQILVQVNETRPADLFKQMNEINAGIVAVLRYLYKTEGIVTAGMISGFMHISTARVAVLLQKMEAKDLIVRGKDAADARVTVVCLSEQGRRMAEAMGAGRPGPGVHRFDDDQGSHHGGVGDLQNLQ